MYTFYVLRDLNLENGKNVEYKMQLKSLGWQDEILKSFIVGRR